MDKARVLSLLVMSSLVLGIAAISLQLGLAWLNTMSTHAESIKTRNTMTALCGHSASETIQPSYHFALIQDDAFTSKGCVGSSGQGKFCQRTKVIALMSLK